MDILLGTKEGMLVWKYPDVHPLLIGEGDKWILVSKSPGLDNPEFS